MRIVAALLFGTLFTNPSHAEAPCDFKGISVGDRLSAAEIMAALGVSKYRTNPKLPFDIKLIEKYGLIPAGEIEDWNTGPYCQDTSCRVPFGVGVGNTNMPVSVFLSFHDGLITEIDVSFSQTNWDEILPILMQKYGVDWTVEREVMPVTNFETKKATRRERISLQHISNGTNQKTNDQCQIWVSNIDIVFEHHDAYGPYHSVFTIKLISKNF